MGFIFLRQVNRATKQTMRRGKTIQAFTYLVPLGGSLNPECARRPPLCTHLIDLPGGPDLPLDLDLLCAGADAARVRRDAAAWAAGAARRASSTAAAKNVV